MNLLRLARSSFALLLAHRARTIGCCVAVVVGVAALVLMAGAGRAAEQDLRARIHELGSNVLAVRAGEFQRFGRHLQQVSRTTSLVPHDVEMLRRRLVGAQLLSGVATTSKSVRWRNAAQVLPIVGVDPEYFDLQRLTMANGREFSVAETRGLSRVVVMGAKAAREVFELNGAVGERIRIAGVPFEVIGVAMEKGGMGLAGVSPDTSVFVPLSTLLTRLMGRDRLDAVLLQSAHAELLPVLRRDVSETLRRAHRLPNGRPDDFTIQEPAALLAAEHDTGETFRALAGGVALVSLSTGGIGIVTVMLMAVRERTREIGLRRAIGATRKAVLWQFLIEGGILTTAGGLAGALFALPANASICFMAGWPVVWPVAATLSSVAFSVALGLLCGVVPAVRAAKLEPVTALRWSG